MEQSITESRLREIIREELVREKVVDVEPYENTLAKVTGTYYDASKEVSVEVRQKDGQPVIYTFSGRGQVLSKAKLGKREAQEIGKALLSLS